MANEKKSVFETLNAVNCNGKVEKKNGLTYLSWSFAWEEVKKHYPNAFYTIYENDYGIPYFNDGHTCWVKTGVTIEGLEHIEYLPIMDFKNKSIPVDAVTSMEMNKAIQRSLTKACARHGLGLYIYAGEDLPESTKEEVLEAIKNAKSFKQLDEYIKVNPDSVSSMGTAVSQRKVELSRDLCRMIDEAENVNVLGEIYKNESPEWWKANAPFLNRLSARKEVLKEKETKKTKKSKDEA